MYPSPAWDLHSPINLPLSHLLRVISIDRAPYAQRMSTQSFLFNTCSPHRKIQPDSVFLKVHLHTCPSLSKQRCIFLFSLFRIVTQHLPQRFPGYSACACLSKTDPFSKRRSPAGSDLVVFTCNTNFPLPCYPSHSVLSQYVLFPCAYP